MLADVVCPISFVTIDRNVVRTNGLVTTVLLVAYVATGWPWIIVPVGLDYVLRARMDGPTSPMAHFAKAVAGVVGLPFREMDKAPKVFASRIGVCFAMGAAITHFVAPAVAPWLAGTLAVFTALESIGDFCVGCHVYSYIVLPLHRARQAVRDIPLFRRLEDPMLAAVADGFVDEHVAADTRLVTAGEPGDRMFVLRSGEVEVFRDEPAGRVVLARQGPGSFFGELALLSSGPRTASVQTLSPVVLLTLHQRDFDRLATQFPRMRALVETTAAERLGRDDAARPV